MITCYVGLGGNVGDTFAALSNALKRLDALPEVFNLASSRAFATSPVSTLKQRNFLNSVCRLQTSLSPDTLIAQLQEIEKAMGRRRRQANDEPRVVDLDLLFYGDLILHKPGLTLPHPRWHQRLFVLAPLLDVFEPPFFVDVRAFAQIFRNPHGETVTPLPQALPFTKLSL